MKELASYYRSTSRQFPSFSVYQVFLAIPACPICFSQRLGLALFPPILQLPFLPDTPRDKSLDFGRDFTPLTYSSLQQCCIGLIWDAIHRLDRGYCDVALHPFYFRWAVCDAQHMIRHLHPTNQNLGV